MKRLGLVLTKMKTKKRDMDTLTS